MSDDYDMLSSANQSILLPQAHAVRAVTTTPVKAASVEKVHVPNESSFRRQITFALISIGCLPLICIGVTKFYEVVYVYHPVTHGSAIFPTRQVQTPAPSASASDMERSRQSDVLLTVVKSMYKSQSQGATPVLHDQLADARSAFTAEGFKAFSQELNGLLSLQETVEDGKQVSLLSYDIPVKGEDPHSMTMRVVLSWTSAPIHYNTATFRAIFLPIREDRPTPLISSLSLNID